MRALVLLLGVAAFACSSGSESGTEGAQTGGSSSTGGASASGGEMSDGGSDPGGSSSGGSDTGGAASDGGASTGGKSTGGTSTGGKSSGGTGGQGTGGQGLPDTDGDGVPDASDECPGGDDEQDLNENGEIDECEPGWCHLDANPAADYACGLAYGIRQGYCTMEDYTADIGPGECVQCGKNRYDCNDDWSDGCEIYTTQGHPCVP